MKTVKNWYVCNNDGALAGHDLDEFKAKATAAEMQEREPAAGWEAMQKEDEIATVDKCNRCGTAIIEAGISNMIDGRCYHGLKELACKEWVVCPECYEQNQNTGEWTKKE